MLQVHVHGVVDDPMLQDGMQARWDHSRLQQHIARAVDQVKPTVVRCSALAGLAQQPPFDTLSAHKHLVPGHCMVGTSSLTSGSKNK